MLSEVPAGENTVTAWIIEGVVSLVVAVRAEGRKAPTKSTPEPLEAECWEGVGFLKLEKHQQLSRVQGESVKAANAEQTKLQAIVY
jgi:hypothetical protein